MSIDERSNPIQVVMWKRKKIEANVLAQLLRSFGVHKEEQSVELVLNTAGNFDVLCNSKWIGIIDIGKGKAIKFDK